MPSEKYLYVTADPEQSEKQVIVHYEGKNVVVKPSHDYKVKELMINTYQVADWIYATLRMLCCSNSPQGDDMSAMRHDAGVKKLCIRCRVTREDNISGRMASERSLQASSIVKRDSTQSTKKRTTNLEDGMEAVDEGKVHSCRGQVKAYWLEPWSAFV